ncbi:MarR family winged helix-turn-helix transcriptional regulator [Cryptosporangium aurantiacum]|uniref:DNA-binding transcriptional regulator, MarR family n=1 Tax=Cryptosporangium aurantiacum TaxID=134849 RepID=A0A1M7TY21_9ACTN|nr:MarR family winged helix-turn-helix transcriptional regulator [Cryptosporangium aurantiacum]SHN75585.1 DNA-binding transcriptional regulator, MarR family [Cryptosporangium aurantiacum]
MAATEDQLAAWRALYRADSLLFAHLNNQLRANVGLTYFEREVLAALDRFDGRLRMAPLADEVMLSRSGATRLVGKMEKDGWVVRTTSAADRRATWAELTPAGRDRLAAARPVVDAVVSTYFADHIGATDLRRTADALRRLADANPGIGEFECGL